MNKRTSESTISFNTPLDVKAKLQRMAQENGVTISDLMRMSVMQVLNSGIHIKPSIEPSDYLLSELRDADSERKSGGVTTIDNTSELSTYLDKLKK